MEGLAYFNTYILRSFVRSFVRFCVLAAWRSDGVVLPGLHLNAERILLRYPCVPRTWCLRTDCFLLPEFPSSLCQSNHLSQAGLTRARFSTMPDSKQYALLLLLVPDYFHRLTLLGRKLV